MVSAVDAEFDHLGVNLGECLEVLFAGPNEFENVSAPCTSQDVLRPNADRLDMVLRVQERCR